MYDNLISGKIKVFQDSHIDEERFKKLPKEIWADSNMSTAYDTLEANKKASEYSDGINDQFIRKMKRINILLMRKIFNLVK